MAWTIFRVPSARKAELDGALADDLVARQSRKIRDAATLGGPAGELFVLIDGTPEGVARAETVLGPVGTKLAGADAEKLYAQLAEEDQASAAGMGLLFTD